ncbi:unnamed protein product [Clonostachys rosea]|uniref:rRNA-processing protein EFG1 n=1 Tax=Bionectria ochroleuca TaxID=29856 RepID=A0ABY6TVN2_BIOOC|nr:unnamed protein product [Clonostachys rosea]
MGTKRPHEELGDENAQADSYSGGRSGPSVKKQRPNGKSKHRAKEGSIEYAKKRARTIERLFQKNHDLPANVRNELERELESHKATVEDKTFQKKRSAMISKYHMVRFFERKKAIRLAKQVRKKIDKCEDQDELEKLRHELHIAEVDEAYAVNHPHAEVYISLYAKPNKSGKDDADEAEEGDEGGANSASSLLHTERPPMWKAVEAALEEGPDALRRLRERRSSDDTQKQKKPASQPNRGTAAKDKTKTPAEAPRKQPASNKPSSSQGKGANPPAMNRRERRRLMRELATPANADEDDGEGFFEDA